MLDSLYRDAELTSPTIAPVGAVMVDGVMGNFAFHPGRIAAHKADIAELCNELPDEFQKSKGGGWSFLNLCVDKHGNHWGEHHTCNELVVLAIGSGQGGFCMPRENWGIFPGGMPFVWFDTVA